MSAVLSRVRESLDPSTGSRILLELDLSGPVSNEQPGFIVRNKRHECYLSYEIIDFAPTTQPPAW